MNFKLDILLLFIFVLSCVYLVNLIVKMVVSVLQTPPEQLVYTNTEKVFNYFFITYTITYLLQIF